MGRLLAVPPNLHKPLIEDNGFHRLKLLIFILTVPWRTRNNKA